MVNPSCEDLHHDVGCLSSVGVFKSSLEFLTVVPDFGREGSGLNAHFIQFLSVIRQRASELVAIGFLGLRKKLTLVQFVDLIFKGSYLVI